MERKLCTLHSLFQRRGTTLRNGIPELWGTKVDVVDAEQVHVFNMPSEGCTPHAEVEVWSVDARKTLVAGREQSG